MSMPQEHKAASLLALLLVGLILALICLISLPPDSRHTTRKKRSLSTLTKGPNIVFILADDLGFNDVSWHNPAMLTPNLEHLAASGLRLDSHYVQPLCTPTRAALMTGYYPIHTGRQHLTIHPLDPVGVYTNYTFLPEYLNRLGYSSHAVGKWHLGYCNEAYLPTRRGFASFYGYHGGAESYFTHDRSLWGHPSYDFWLDERPDMSANGTYSATLFARRAEEIICQHADLSSPPLFLYLSLQSVHGPLQVPERYRGLYPSVKEEKRSLKLGMISAMDEAVGKVVEALKANKMYDNTIIVFTSDNGGVKHAGSSNSPLKGEKRSLYEGGTRTAAFVHAPSETLLGSRAGQMHQGLFHVTDWLPTLVSAVAVAGHDALDSGLNSIDGFDQWESLKAGSPSPRREVLYNIEEKTSPVALTSAAIRVGEWKLIRDVYKSRHGKKISWLPTRVHGKIPWMLFNLTADPSESRDLYADNPEVVARLHRRLDFYRASAIPPHRRTTDPNGMPVGGFAHVGWCKAEP